jgi:hypothetical protein
MFVKTLHAMTVDAMTVDDCLPSPTAAIIYCTLAQRSQDAETDMLVCSCLLTCLKADMCVYTIQGVTNLQRTHHTNSGSSSSSSMLACTCLPGHLSEYR